MICRENKNKEWKVNGLVIVSTSFILYYGEEQLKLLSVARPNPTSSSGDGLTITRIPASPEVETTLDMTPERGTWNF